MEEWVARTEAEEFDLLLALSRWTMPGYLARRLDDPDWDVRRTAVKFRLCPSISVPGFLDRRAPSEDLVAAMDPESSRSLLARLAGDRRWLVRRGVAGNPNTSVDVLRILASDVFEGVRNSVAWNDVTPPEVLAVLAADPAWIVRVGVAWHPDTPTETLEPLRSDEDERVSEAATQHPAMQ